MPTQTKEKNQEAPAIEVQKAAPRSWYDVVQQVFLILALKNNGLLYVLIVVCGVYVFFIGSKVSSEAADECLLSLVESLRGVYFSISIAWIILSSIIIWWLMNFYRKELARVAVEKNALFKRLIGEDCISSKES